RTFDEDRAEADDLRADGVRRAGRVGLGRRTTSHGQDLGRRVDGHDDHDFVVDADAIADTELDRAAGRRLHRGADGVGEGHGQRRAWQRGVLLEPVDGDVVGWGLGQQRHAVAVDTVDQGQILRGQHVDHAVDVEWGLGRQVERECGWAYKFLSHSWSLLFGIVRVGKIATDRLDLVLVLAVLLVANHGPVRIHQRHLRPIRSLVVDDLGVDRGGLEWRGPPVERFGWRRPWRHLQPFASQPAGVVLYAAGLTVSNHPRGRETAKRFCSSAAA